MSGLELTRASGLVYLGFRIRAFLVGSRAVGILRSRDLEF